MFGEMVLCFLLIPPTTRHFFFFSSAPWTSPWQRGQQSSSLGKRSRVFTSKNVVEGSELLTHFCPTLPGTWTCQYIFIE